LPQKRSDCFGYEKYENVLGLSLPISNYTQNTSWGRLCQKFGQKYSHQIKKSRGTLGDTWYLDEVFIKINGVQHYLWRAVDQDVDELDILVQKRRDRKAAKRFFKKLLKGQQVKPLKIVTDKLRSYSAAKREVMPSVEQSTKQYPKQSL